MTPELTALIDEFAQASNEVTKVSATKTLYVEDLHTHDHGDTDHNDTGHPDCCECSDCCSQHDHLQADVLTTPQANVAAKTTQGTTIEVAQTEPTTPEPMSIFQFPIDIPAMTVEASGIGTESAMQSGYTSGGGAASSFNIKITYGGDLQGALAEAFSTSAEYFSQIILKDVSDLTNGLDDIEINATLIEIDGAGSILGRAGPQYIRSSNYLPTEAIMEFDVADAQNFADQGLWDDIVFHEMLHTLGFGTLWGYMDLRDGSISGGDMRFNGTHANDVYEDEFANLNAADGFDFGVPIETDGGAGTAGGHWDEGTFNNEIMTGYVNGANFMSWMSIAALEDMGYDTIYDNPYDAHDAFGAAPAGDPLDIV